jgi:hypothetical protein
VNRPPALARNRADLTFGGGFGNDVRVIIPVGDHAATKRIDAAFSSRRGSAPVR